MMTRERELLQQALDALDRAISDDRAYIRALEVRHHE